MHCSFSFMSQVISFLITTVLYFRIILMAKELTFYCSIFLNSLNDYFYLYFVACCQWLALDFTPYDRFSHSDPIIATPDYKYHKGLWISSSLSQLFHCWIIILMTEPSDSNNFQNGHPAINNPLPTPHSPTKSSNSSSMGRSQAPHHSNPYTPRHQSFTNSVRFGMKSNHPSYISPSQLQHAANGEQSPRVHQVPLEEILKDPPLTTTEQLEPLPVILKIPGSMEELISLCLLAKP